MIREPQKYDVIVMPNLYGDLLSDAAGLMMFWPAMSGAVPWAGSKYA